MRCSTLEYNCLSEPCSFPSLLARRQRHVAKLRQLHLLSCKTLFSFTSMLLPKACRIRTSSLPRSACATAYNLPAFELFKESSSSMCLLQQWQPFSEETKQPRQRRSPLCPEAQAPRKPSQAWHR